MRCFIGLDDIIRNQLYHVDAARDETAGKQKANASSVAKNIVDVAGQP